jgi:hypothetical protein
MPALDSGLDPGELPVQDLVEKRAEATSEARDTAVLPAIRPKPLLPVDRSILFFNKSSVHFRDCLAREEKP